MNSDSHPITVSIPAKSQKAVVLHNTGTQSIILNHPVPDPGASAGWASKLNPDHWSVLQLHNNNARESLFLITCHRQTKNNQFSEVNCLKHIKHYQIKFKLPKKLHNGDFWLTENKQHKQLKQALKKRGVSISKQQLHDLGFSTSS